MDARQIIRDSETIPGIIAKLPEVYERYMGIYYWLLTWTDTSGNKQIFQIGFEKDNEFWGYFCEGKLNGWGAILKTESIDDYLKRLSQDHKAPVETVRL
jgi:hypothetical protein